jgi:apolipoprotein N-acyltransferase
MRIAPNICYEDLIPSLVSKSLKIDKKRANLILNATNDSWFGNSIETNIHLRISGFRSIENRRTLIRATCTGYSGVFLPNGTLMPIWSDETPKYKSELLEEDRAVAEVPLLEIDTFYNKYGWFFIYLVAISFVIIFCIDSYQKLKFKKFREKKYNNRDYKRKLQEMWLD